MLKVILHLVVAASLVGVGLLAGLWTNGMQQAAAPSIEESLQHRVDQQAKELRDIAARLEAIQEERDRGVEARLLDTMQSLRAEIDLLGDRIIKAESSASRIKVMPATNTIATLPPQVERETPTPAWRTYERTSHRGNPPTTSERIRLREGLLYSFPEDKESARLLEELIADCLRINNVAKARAMLRAFGHLLPEWNLDRLSAAIAFTTGDYGEARKLLLAMREAEELPEWARADSMLQYASSFLAEGNRDEAKQQFQALIDYYGATPPPGVNDSLQAARTQLTALDTQ